MLAAAARTLLMRFRRASGQGGEQQEGAAGEGKAEQASEAEELLLLEMLRLW